MRARIEKVDVLGWNKSPTTMPQSLKLIDKFKAEVGTTPKGRADSSDEYVVAFSHAQICAQIMVCHH